MFRKVFRYHLNGNKLGVQIKFPTILNDFIIFNDYYINLKKNVHTHNYVVLQIQGANYLKTVYN